MEKDDIPMQRQACREFAVAQGWEIVEECQELGVSGYKVSSQDRDQLQEIRGDAMLGKFDILLVFLFDHIGRRDDETPFVVEWFVQNGIQVWSVKEGQQTFGEHVDKLTKDYRMEIDLNMSYEEYAAYWAEDSETASEQPVQPVGGDISA